jgi:polyhydroxyalkanoate synthesis regulator phasin
MRREARAARHRHDPIAMDQGNLLQMLLLRGLGTTTLVADRLRYVTQEWVRSGKLDPSHASALVEDVMKALRGETPGLEAQAERQLERNRDQLLGDLGLARQRELDELRGRIDRLEQLMRQRLGDGEKNS